MVEHPDSADKIGIYTDELLFRLEKGGWFSDPAFWKAHPGHTPGHRDRAGKAVGKALGKAVGKARHAMLRKLGKRGKAVAEARGKGIADRLCGERPGLTQRDVKNHKRLCHAIIDIMTGKARGNEHTSNLTTAGRNPPACSGKTGDLFKRRELEGLPGFKANTLHRGRTVTLDQRAAQTPLTTLTVCTRVRRARVRRARGRRRRLARSA